MKVYELLGFNKELLKRFHQIGIKLEDYKYIELYKEYNELLTSGDKVTYIVMVLAEKHGVSERQIYNIVSKFSKDIDYCKMCAVE